MKDCMKNFTHFIFYNNTVPLIFGVLFLGAGATFAASPEARDTVVDSSSKIISIDNSYLLNTEITDDVVEIQTGSVTEDDTMYYVEYQITTIGVQDGMWKPVIVSKTLEVQKDTIPGEDLGLYASKELSEVHAREVRRLKYAQEVEQSAGLTPKVIATEYSGLVGRFLDTEKEVFPGYDPFIEPIASVPLTPEQKAEYDRQQKELQEQEVAAGEETQDVTEAVSGETFTIPPIVSPAETPAEEEMVVENDDTSSELSPESSQTEQVPSPEPVSETVPEIGSEPEQLPSNEPTTEAILDAFLQ
ncbi:MAG: hypothetical protein RL538_482 [Candidatus Parcubacteria bacterium]|jgi:hypothetical protein